MHIEQTSLSDEFADCFGVWEEARPFLDLMVEESEMRLLVAIGEGSLTAGEAARLFGVSVDEAAGLLRRCYSRYLLDREIREVEALYSLGAFSDFLDHFAKFENWDEIPPEDRRRMDRRFLDEFIARLRPNVESKVQGLDAENALPNDAVLLLHEVEEMIDAAEHIVVQPCDCRRLGQNCERPVETCVWLDDSALESLDRGHGRRLTRQEAKDLLRWADKKGLMHTADSDWRTRGLHAICNCCACDCYPFRAAQELGSKGAWPRSRYIAVYDPKPCDLCGACVKRCHFEAFYHDGSYSQVGDKSKLSVLYAPARCWGCGLCANTCPTGAIRMEPWP